MADVNYGDTVTPITCPGDHIKSGIIARNLTLDQDYKLTQRDATVNFPQVAFKGRTFQAGNVPFQTEGLPEDNLSGYTQRCSPSLIPGPSVRKGMFPKFTLARPTSLANLFFAPGGEIASTQACVKTRQICWSIAIKQNPLDFFYYPFIPRRKNAFFWRIIQFVYKSFLFGPVINFPADYVSTVLDAGTIIHGHFQGLPTTVSVTIPHIFNPGDSDGFRTVETLTWMQYTWDTSNWPTFTFFPTPVDPADLDLSGGVGPSGPCGTDELSPK